MPTSTQVKSGQGVKLYLLSTLRPYDLYIQLGIRTALNLNRLERFMTGPTGVWIGKWFCYGITTATVDILKDRSADGWKDGQKN
jgi:hypothetical protein